MAHHMMAPMKMYFHFGYEEQFLFETLSVNTPLKLWTACGVLFLLTILFEAIKYIRCVRCGCDVNRANCAATNGNGACSGDLQDNDTNVRLAAATHSCYVGKLHTRRHRLIQTLLHTLQTVVGFFLMLSVMSFNLCIIFAIVAGTATGYFVFYRAYNEIESIHSCH